MTTGSALPTLPQSVPRCTIIANQHHIGGFHRHIGASADGDSKIGLDKCRSIVDAIADHGDAQAAVTQLFDLCGLLIGQYLRNVFVDAEFSGNSLCNSFRVPGQHNRTYSKLSLIGPPFELSTMIRAGFDGESPPPASPSSYRLA
jgi:hypothetical protein